MHLLHQQRLLALPTARNVLHVLRAHCFTAVMLVSTLLAVSGCSSLRQSDTSLPRPFAQALQQAGIPQSAVALVVRPVESEATGITGSAPLTIALNEHQPFQPASVMKLLSSAAALDILGPDFRWLTRVHTNGTLQGEVLQGDLVIEGGGDPRLAHEDLGRLLRSLRQLGLREIRGDLVLDRSLFKAMPRDAAAFDGQPSRAYNALPDALLLDAHAINVRFIPEPGSVRVLVEPPLDGFTIMPPPLADDTCLRLREQLQPELSAQGLRFNGTYPRDCGERELAFHLHTLDPVQYFGAAFRTLWRELGGSWSGQVRDGRVPTGSRELLAWPSRPLAQVLVDINKQSNNVMARNLMLSLVAQRGGEPASADAASARVLAWMVDHRIVSQGTVIENGSGLSRAERLSAQTLASVLQHAWAQPTIPELLASLPVAGIDGTMVKRNGTSPVRGRAHIKTGSLAGVASIAGYVQAKSGRRVIVVCMINHPNANAARGAFDQLLDSVYDNY
jgi:D-alanyl-D-alanine carboxypeptidase/D-alanyl-D-alanine-endopeptidase (penicillin-binding protein 4)